MAAWRKKLKVLWKAWPVHRFDEIQGYLTPVEARALYRFARQTPDNAAIVEIGSWKGRSTYCLAKGLRSGRVYAIDPFDMSGDAPSEALYQEEAGAIPLLEQFRTNMRRLHVADKVEPRPGRSEDYRDAFGAIDLLFIDGDHSIEACRRDFTGYAPHVKRGGCVLFHDYHPEQADLGPTWVVDHLVLPGGEYTCAGRADSIWAGRKR